MQLSLSGAEESSTAQTTASRQSGKRGPSGSLPSPTSPATVKSAGSGSRRVTPQGRNSSPSRSRDIKKPLAERHPELRKLARDYVAAGKYPDELNFYKRLVWLSDVKQWGHMIPAAIELMHEIEDGR